MAQDFEQLLRDVFGEPIAKLTQFQTDKMNQLMAKLKEIARESVKDDLSRLTTEVAELRTRLARLEEERAEAAADRVVQ